MKKAIGQLAMLAAGIAAYIFGKGVEGTLLNGALLVFGFVLLIKGADWFVESASKIADKLGIPQLIIGLTIVAFGTSAPEAAVSITAAIGGESVDIAIGNVLGSNIMNVLLILGLASIICPLAVQKQTRRFEIPFVIFITGLTLVLGYMDGNIGRVDGIILFALMLCFLGYLLISAKKGTASVEEGEGADENDKMGLLVLLVLIGGALIVVGSNVTVTSAVVLARTFGMSERLVGLTIIAFGTSLPELITSCMAAAKKKADIAVGNIVGSNIFNLLFVMAITAIITPLPYGVTFGGAITSGFLIDNIAAIFAVVLLLICVINKNKKLMRWGGLLMLISYAGYFVYLIK